MAIEEFNDPSKLAELEAAIVIMSEIIVRISSMDVNTHGRDLLTWCTTTRSKLLDIKSQCLRQGMSVICRPTPYVVYMYGSSGVGKSHVLNALAPEISQPLGVPDRLRGAVYSRCQGMKHFDGVGEQQILLYDDFAQFTTANPENTDAAELFQLVTDQPFRPNMAQVEQKGRILDIKLVLIASNQSHPKVTYVTSHEALWRRRNVLIYADLKGNASLPGNNDIFDPKFSHLTFKIHESVASPDSKKYIKEVDFEGLVEYLREDATKFAIAEKSKVKHKLARQNTHIPKSTPMSVEALEAAVVQTLTDVSNANMYTKFFSIGDNIQRAKDWLRSKFSFMYDPEKETQAEKEMDAALDKALVIDGVKDIKIDESNFLQYLQPKWYEMLDDTQKKALATIYKDVTDMDLLIIDGKPALEQGSGEAGEDEIVSTPLEPIVVNKSITVDPLIQEFSQFKNQNVLLNHNTANMFTHGIIPPQVNLDTYIFCKSFKDKFTQLSSFLTEQWAICHDGLDKDIYKRAIKAIQERPCMHTRRPYGETFTVQPHCRLMKSSAEKDKKKLYIPFHY